MMCPYITFGDGTEVVQSQIIHDDGVDKVLVHFERPREDGFDSARCELPSCTWTDWEGHFTQQEKVFFEDFLRNNAHLLYRYAASGGCASTHPPDLVGQIFVESFDGLLTATCTWMGSPFSPVQEKMR